MEVRIGDLTVHYRCEGEGPPLVLIHGGGVDLESWDPQVPSLRDSFTVYRIDLRGFGRSLSPRGRVVTAIDWVEDLKGFIDHLELKSPGLIGWALGGCIAARFASVYPDAIRYIAMIGSPGPVSSVEISGIQSRVELMRSGASPEEVVERTFEYSKAAISPAVLATRPEVADALKAALKRNMRADYPELMRLFPGAVTTAEELQRIRCPALVLVGEHDVRTPPSMSGDICKYIERSYMKVLRDCGHFYAYEQPQLCARYIREFDAFVAKVLTASD